MRPAESKPHPPSSAILAADSTAVAAPAPGMATDEMPTCFATDLLEKLIADRDAAAVRRAVTAGRRP
jgi:hypothetical protein